MSNVTPLFENLARPAYLPDDLRIAEALIFASDRPIERKVIASRISDRADVDALLVDLQRFYALRGVNLVRVGSAWMFRTSSDLAWLMQKEDAEKKKLTRAALETLAIVAYHQPVTRADVEEIRGVAVSKGSLDVLMEAGWVRMRGRRKAPGRPITYGTTPEFLLHFGLDAVSDLPGLDELAGAGLFEGRLPSGFGVPTPDDADALRADEDPLDASGALEEAWSAVLPEEGH